MSTGPEAGLQILLHKWVKEHVPEPKLFFSVDRAAKRGRFDHVRQAARGQISGLPDTFLIWSGQIFACELKAPGNAPTALQRDVGAALQAAGAHWFWAIRITEYAAFLRDHGVPLKPMAFVAATASDLTIASAAILKKEAKTGKPARGRSASLNKPARVLKASVAKRAAARGIRV